LFGVVEINPSAFSEVGSFRFTARTGNGSNQKGEAHREDSGYIRKLLTM